VLTVCLYFSYFSISSYAHTNFKLLLLRILMPGSAILKLVDQSIEEGLTTTSKRWRSSEIREKNSLGGNGGRGSSFLLDDHQFRNPKLGTRVNSPGPLCSIGCKNKLILNQFVVSWIQYTNGENEIKHNNDQCLTSMLIVNAALRHQIQTSNVKCADL
jgi:hypothetical protein